MKKFFREDIKYVERTNWTGFHYTCEHQYHFSVRGESANYLINKYNLFGKDVKIHYFDDTYITVTSHDPKGSQTDVAEIDSEDIKELMLILQEDIQQDQRQWEEYVCDSEYYMWDTRWSK